MDNTNPPTPAKEVKEDWEYDLDDEWIKIANDIPHSFTMLKDLISDIREHSYNRGYREASEKAGHHFIHEEMPAKIEKAITTYVEAIKGILEESKVGYDVHDCDCKAGKTKSFNDGIEVAITLLTYHGK